MSVTNRSRDVTTGDPTRDGGDHVFPASFAQRRLWFLEQLEPDTALYNVPVAFRLTGPLDVPALERAYDTLLERHEILRTQFVVEQGEPMQLVSATPHDGARMRLFDLSSGAPENAEHRALQRAQAEIELPFDVARGPLVRALLMRMATDDHVLVITLHHAITDAWSIEVLLRELGTAYGDFRTGVDPVLPAMDLQYADYAIWQNAWLQGERLDRALEYWRKQLRSPIPPLALPTDRPRPPIRTIHGARHTIRLSGSSATAIARFCRQKKVTLFTTALAAFGVLLNRHSGQTDILVGTPVANRSRPGLDRVLGLFLNTVVLRMQVDPDESFRTHLARVRDLVVDGMANQDVPFEKLVEELAPARDASRSPFFQAVLVVEHAHATPLVLHELSIAELDGLRPSTAKVDLSLHLTETEGSVEVAFQYNTDLFDAGTVTRMAEHFRMLLEGAAEAPNTANGALPLLTAAEFEWAVRTVNSTDAPFPADRTIHDLVEQQVDRTPNACAVVCESESLTYRELDARANQLSVELRARGVGPGVLVGVCMERSVELLVALLGVLKAGGGYVPLDPDYPEARLALMIRETRAPVVLCQARFTDRLAGADGFLLAVDAEAARLAMHPTTRVTSSAGPGDLAYVIYTSGSTGTPKGVMVPHRGIVNRLWSSHTTTPLTATDRVLQRTPYHFDASVSEIFWPLMGGARLVVARPGGHGDADYLSELIEDAGITTIHFVPSMLRVFLGDPRVGRCDSLRRIVSGGESMTRELQEACFARFPGISLVNKYGPTEASIAVTEWTCCPDDARAVAPIGRPIANAQTYVLDARRQPVPVGVTGELYLGGVGVCRGYLDRPELTAERFVPDPFRPSPDARLYRTGDLARRAPGGELEFQGRVDLQVKLRGFRIELGEIEATIARCAGIRAVAVTVRDASPGDQRLVAYLVATDAPEVAVPRVRAALAASLPDYMRPAAFVFLDELPLTVSGKIDRHELPAPDFSARDHAAPLLPLETGTEVAVGKIWQGLLGTGAIGRHDDFFALGGHSLLATQVVTRIRTTLHRDVALRTLFEHPTLEALARRIDEAAVTEPSHGRGRITRVAHDDALPLSFSQERMWILHQMDRTSLAYNVPAALRLRGTLDRTALQRAMNLLVERHEVLRTTYRLEQHGPVQVVQPDVAGTLPYRDLRPLGDAAADEGLKIATAAARQPFDLANGPALKPLLLQVADEEQLLLLSMHHIATDQWSNGVIRRELSAAYNAFRSGVEPKLPALPVRYRDYATWQRQTFQGEILDRQLAYWRRQLEGVPALDLPTDFARPPVDAGHGAIHVEALPDDLVASLREFSLRHDATLFMTTLATFVALMHRYSGQHDIAVAVPIANRERERTELLVGTFVNTLIMRAAFPDDMAFEDLLRQVRQTALDAYSNQELPFEKLVGELNPVRDLSRAPLAQVLFTSKDAQDEDIRFEGLEWSPAVIDTGSSQFDLGFSVISGASSSVGIEYNTELFTADTVKRMASHYRTLLEAIVEDAARPVATLPLLAPSDEEWIIRTLNATESPLPADPVLHRLIEAQVERSPTSVAVAVEHETLTYRELDSRANALARRLRSAGVHPGVLVALCLRRDLDLPVALLGVLKAGGAYVPMDPAFPAERLTFMLADSGAAVLVGTDAMPAGVTLPPGLRIVDLNDETAQDPGLHPGSADDSAGPDDRAYVLYTSGSTGRPKGVAVSHRALVNLLWSMKREPGLKETDVLAAVTTISFDISGLELYLPLLVGARIELVDGDVAASGAALAERLDRSGATTLQATPATWRLLVEAGWRPRPGFRALCGGEALPRTLADRLLEGVTELWNLYGPTETTIWSTVGRVTGGDDTVSIGRPIANTRIYVVDRAGQPTPIGVPGEIWIGGAGLASGYHGRPDLTAERFIADRFGGKPGDRLYRTGDLGRWRADGRLDHLGRLDTQVKIRGFRIELEEIEHVLSTHPAVVLSAAVVRAAAPEDLRLVLYVKYRDGASLTVSEVRRYLRRELPEYMIPSIVVPLDVLPLTPNGKTDRAALPDPFKGVNRSATERREPAPGTEQQLAGIWREILNADSVGADDNFFELGGHSLLSLRVSAAVRERLGWRLDPRALFFQSLRQVAAGFSLHSDDVGDGEPG